MTTQRPSPREREHHARPPGLVVAPGANRPHPLRDEVAACSTALAPFLPAPPACVALWRLPGPAALAVYHAVRAAGLVPVMLNDRWSDADATSALRVVPSALVVRGDDGAGGAASIRVSSAPEVVICRARGAASPSYNAVVVVESDHSGAHEARTTTTTTTTPFAPHEQAPAVVFFTSGTTAAPKAVALSDAQLCLQSAAKRDTLGLSRDTRYLHVGPLFHVGGFSAAHATTSVGGTHVFAAADGAAHLGRAAEARHVLCAARDANVSFVSAVPSALRLLLDASRGGAAAPLALPAVRVVLYGAAPLAPAGGGGDKDNASAHAGASAVCAVLDELRALFPRASVVGAYGMTETASSVTFLRHDELPRASALHASAGWPAAGHGVEVRVRGGVGGVGGAGEIETRGPHVIRGYVGAARGAARSWWRTGDIGRIDPASGALFVLGRLHDVIRCGGEKVLAAEVEAALVCASGVRDAAVVGVPHRVLGEAVAAAIVLAEDGDGDTDAETLVSAVVARACAGLARYKRPRWVFAEPYLPRNASGKVVKRELRARLQQRIVVSTPTAKL